MAVRFRKRVEIVNAKLTLGHRTLQVIALVILVWRFFAGRQFAREVDVSDAVTASMRVNGASDVAALSLATVSRNATSRLCTIRGEWDYWRDSSGLERYENHRCMPVCPPNLASLGCVPAAEAYLEQAAPASVLLPTQITDTYLPEAGAGGAAAATQSYFVLSTEELSISLTYRFGVESSSPSGLSSSRDKALRASMATGAPIPMVVLNSDGEVWKSYESGSTLELTVAELLDLAGSPELLGVVNPKAGANKKPGGAHAAGPSTRVSGVEVKLAAECYSPQSAYMADVALSGDVACALRTSISPKAWVTDARVDRDSNGLLYRRYHGVRIVTETRGVIQIVDPDMIYLCIVAAFVVLGLIEGLTFLFTCHMLGQMSTVYKQVLLERFDMLGQVAGMSARLLAGTACQLEDSDGRKGKGSSWRGAGRKLARVLEPSADRLEQDELAAFVRFCFRQVTVTREAPSRIKMFKNFWCDVCSPCAGAGDLEIADAPITLSIDDISGACGSAERPSVDVLAAFFEEHRTPGILEQLFIPREVFRELKLAKKEGSGSPPKLEKMASEFSARQSSTAEATATSIAKDEQATAASTRVSSQDKQATAASARVSSEEEAEKRTKDAQEEAEKRIKELRRRLDASERRLQDSERRLVESERRLLESETNFRSLRDSVSVLEGKLDEAWQRPATHESPLPPFPQEADPMSQPNESSTAILRGEIAELRKAQAADLNDVRARLSDSILRYVDPLQKLLASTTKLANELANRVEMLEQVAPVTLKEQLRGLAQKEESHASLASRTSSRTSRDVGFIDERSDVSDSDAGQSEPRSSGTARSRVGTLTVRRQRRETQGVVGVRRSRSGASTPTALPQVPLGSAALSALVEAPAASGWQPANSLGERTLIV